VAEDILGQCTTKTFLRAGGPITATWAENYFGKVRQIEKTVTETSSKDGSSVSTQYKSADRSMFLASVFLNLPLPAKGRQFMAISDVPFLGQTVISKRWSDELFSMLAPASGAGAVALALRSNLADQKLLDWDADDTKMFCAPPNPEPSGQGRENKPAEIQPPPTTPPPATPPALAGPPPSVSRLPNLSERRKLKPPHQNHPK